MKLREIFQEAKRKNLPKSWLYLPIDVPWSADTEGVFLDWENEEKDADEIPLTAKQGNLRESLDYATIEDIVDWADRLTGLENESARLEVFLYYFKFDAFPDRLGAPDPPSPEETMRRLDRKFYDLLGDERPGTKCRDAECVRGTVKFSVFCRTHHFEQIKKRPCPFND